jgi:hypothetical protein
VTNFDSEDLSADDFEPLEIRYPRPPEIVIDRVGRGQRTKTLSDQHIADLSRVWGRLVHSLREEDARPPAGTRTIPADEGRYIVEQLQGVLRQIDQQSEEIEYLRMHADFVFQRRLQPKHAGAQEMLIGEAQQRNIAMRSKGVVGDLASLMLWIGRRTEGETEALTRAVLVPLASDLIGDLPHAPRWLVIPGLTRETEETEEPRLRIGRKLACFIVAYAAKEAGLVEARDPVKLEDTLIKYTKGSSGG